jgi:hypothetical protein
MDNTQKNLALLGIAAIGIGGMVLIAKALWHQDHTSIYEKVGKGIDERLKESKEALERASVRVQSAFEHIKTRKP